MVGCGRVVAGVGEAVQVARGTMHRGLSCRRHRRLELAGKQSPRLADVISGEIQHGRGYLLPVPTDRDCEAPSGGVSSSIARN